MSTSIPTSTSVVESAVIKAPLSKVWHLVKLGSFADFWSALESSKLVKGVSDDTDVVEWTFKDGSVVQVKQEEHSVSLSSFTAVTRINNAVLFLGWLVVMLRG